MIYQNYIIFKKRALYVIIYDIIIIIIIALNYTHAKFQVIILTNSGLYRGLNMRIVPITSKKKTLCTIKNEYISGAKIGYVCLRAKNAMQSNKTTFL